MNPLSGDLTFVDASGWIALVSANDTPCISSPCGFSNNG